MKYYADEPAGNLISRNRIAERLGVKPRTISRRYQGRNDAPFICQHTDELYKVDHLARHLKSSVEFLRSLVRNEDQALTVEQAAEVTGMTAAEFAHLRKAINLPASDLMLGHDAPRFSRNRLQKAFRNRLTAFKTVADAVVSS